MPMPMPMPMPTPPVRAHAGEDRSPTADPQAARVCPDAEITRIEFRAVADRWPKQAGLREARHEWTRALTREGGRWTQPALVARCVDWAAALETHVDQKFHPRLDRWLAAGGYNDPPPTAPAVGSTKGRATVLGQLIAHARETR